VQVVNVFNFLLVFNIFQLCLLIHRKNTNFTTIKKKPQAQNQFEMCNQENIIWRRLSSTDFDKGYIALLSQLSTVGNVDKSVFLCRFQQLEQNSDYYILVAEDINTSTVIASGTLFIELKFLHSCQSVGHIEDIVVSKEYRRLGLGKKLVERLVQEARNRNCYKAILSCSPANVTFYKKCNFVQKELQMVQYFHE